jgi:hypothetical protein
MSLTQIYHNRVSGISITPINVKVDLKQVTSDFQEISKFGRTVAVSTNAVYRCSTLETVTAGSQIKNPDC